MFRTTRIIRYAVKLYYARGQAYSDVRIRSMDDYDDSLRSTIRDRATSQCSALSTKLRQIMRSEHKVDTESDEQGFTPRILEDIVNVLYL